MNAETLEDACPIDHCATFLLLSSSRVRSAPATKREYSVLAKIIVRYGVAIVTAGKCGNLSLQIALPTCAHADELERLAYEAFDKWGGIAMSRGFLEQS